MGDAIKVRLAAPPEDGAANRALLGLVADRLGVPRRAVTLVSGAASRLKVVAVEDLDEAPAEARLPASSVAPSEIASPGVARFITKS